jgi:hypothetical protein
MPLGRTAKYYRENPEARKSIRKLLKKQQLNLKLLKKELRLISSIE